MNFKKGLFRLTLVLSISVGIISSFVMIEREPYTKYKVKRTGEGIKELTVTFLWHEERNPDTFDFLEVFQEAEKTNKNVIEVNPTITTDFTPVEEKGKGTGIIDPLEVKPQGTVTKAPPIVREGGKGKPKFVDPFDPLGLLDKERKSKEDLSWLPNPPVSQKEVKKEPMSAESFTIVKKTANPIKWNRFFLIMGIGFTSIWFIYAFIRWVIVFFVIGGFKSKATQ